MGDTIEHSVIVRAAPESVFSAIGDGAGWDAWFTHGTVLEQRVGGVIRLRWRNWGPQRITAEDGGLVTAYEAPRRLAFDWNPDPHGDATNVDIKLRPHPSGTLLALTDGEYAETPSGRGALVDCAVGWGEALTLIKFWVEHGVRY